MAQVAAHVPPTMRPGARASMLMVTVMMLLMLGSVAIGPAQAYLDDRQPVYLEAKVGSYVVLDCPVDFPQDEPIPYVLHWNKDVSSEDQALHGGVQVVLSELSIELIACGGGGGGGGPLGSL
ncbi:hypothetical protein AND_009500 [Anopheles darlingi]|uniref:Secreted protein n=1 Tax=Anopheles darlingi TaxID=43151 RepID=W5J4Q7_ANODA|nr:hypothetical protein AND_009500 [Anopheles darlingi]